MKLSIFLVLLATMIAPNAFAGLSYKCTGVMIVDAEKAKQAASATTVLIQEAGKDTYSITITDQGDSITGTMSGAAGSDSLTVQLGNDAVTASGTAKSIEAAISADKNHYMKLDLSVNRNSDLLAVSGVFTCN